MTGAPPWRILEPWPRVGEGERRTVQEADAPVRERIAAWLHVESVDLLRLDVVLRPWLDGLHVVGRLEAAVGRVCGVTLDPYEEEVRETIDQLFLPPGSPNLPNDGAEEVSVELDAQDPPEPGEVDGVDLGAVGLEALSLGLPPFARKPGVAFDAPASEDEPSPFAVLASLMNRRPDES